MFPVLFVLSMAIVSVALSATWRAFYWHRRGVLAAKRCLPLCGNMWEFCTGRQHYGDVYEAIYKAHPTLPYVGINRLFNEPAILLRSQELVKAVLVRNFSNFHDNVLWIDAKRDPLVACNPFVAKGEQWKQMRAEIAPIFTPTKVKMSFPHIAAICEKLAGYVQRMHDACVQRDTIVGHCSTFLLEGFETSSSLMAFAVFEYARNSHVQRRVQREIDEVLRQHNGVLSHEALHQMSYMEATLYETLRFYPPMLALSKRCTKPFELPPQAPHSQPFRVPVGMACVVPVKAIHNDPDLYPEPMKFLPERFMGGQDDNHIDDKNNQQRGGCKFLGFGEGPRMCPGMRFGLAQSKAGLATLLAKYDVELASKIRLPLQLATTTFLTVPKDGIWVRFRPRQA